MRYADLKTLLDRLDRVHRALDMGCASVAHSARPDVADALLETCWEGVRLGHELTRRLAYDDLWSDLEVLREVWIGIAEQSEPVAALDHRAEDALRVALAVGRALDEVVLEVGAVDDAQLRVAARPRDPEAARTATAAIRRLESAADRFFVDALGDDRLGRLDAAMAVLTTIASRAARERAAVARRG